MGSIEPLVAASLLSANFARMEEAVRMCETAGCDLLHMDVMDGVFVPNITFGPKMVKDIASVTSLPLDVHLMITSPEHYIDDFAEAGAYAITVHAESTIHLDRTLTAIRERGKLSGVSIVPSSSVSLITEILRLTDIVLVMTVNPGFGGQKMIPETLRKVQALKTIRGEEKLRYKIAVDGGINAETASLARSAGADILVSGSSFFASADPKGEVMALKGYKVV